MFYSRLHLRALLLAAAGGAAVIGGSPAVAQPASAPCAAPPAAAGGPSNAHTRHIEMNLQPAVIKAGDKPHTLAERMRAYEVPGVSVAVINGGKLDWARGWGFRDTSRCAPVTPDTA